MSVNTGLVLLTGEQLAALVKTAVCEALAELRDEPTPALLDRTGIARALGIGLTTVDRLRRDGLPCVLIGDSPRFEVNACVEWLRRHHRHPTQEAAADTAAVPPNEHPPYGLDSVPRLDI
jgi:hypothetical protein